MKKRKLFFQIGTSAIILMAAFSMSKADDQTIMEYYEKAKAHVMNQMDASDLKDVWSDVTGAIAGAPAKVVSAVVEANNQSRYGEPIDEKSETDIKQVHAVAGGVVESSGKSEDKGLFVVIRHEDAVSTYGNLSNINVVPKERVKRGEIIGSFDESGEKEFYYQLDEEV